MANISGIQLGFNARLFPEVWRPAVDEIAFASREGFAAIQFPGSENGLDQERLGGSFEEVADALKRANIAAVMEIVVRVDQQGMTCKGHTPLQVLEANLPAITALSCTCVHWHLVPRFTTSDFSEFEQSFVPQFKKAVDLGSQHDFVFGFEHNEPNLGLFATPDACAALLNRVPDLGFVWDLNHTKPEHLSAFLVLTPRMSMLHISDTPLPAVNYHLPLGAGSTDFARYFGELSKRGFQGIGILEIGGLPHSGGYGQDTDEALQQSKTIFEQAQKR